MTRRCVERRDVRLFVGACHLELHDAGIGQTDVRRSVIRGTAEYAFKDVTRVNNLVTLERFECRAPFNPCAMRREQLLERVVAGPRGCLTDRAGKTISLTRHCLDVGFAIGPVGEKVVRPRRIARRTGEAKWSAPRVGRAARELRGAMAGRGERGEVGRTAAGVGGAEPSSDVPPELL